jgi:hypothetical protein
MVRIKLSGVNDSVLVEYLGLYAGLDWKRTWSTDEFMVGVFEFKPHLRNGDVVVVLIVESDNHLDECNIWLHPHGITGNTAGGLLDGPKTVYWHKVRDDILELADKNGWSCEVEKASYRRK